MVEHTSLIMYHLSKIGFAKPVGKIFNGYYEHEQLMETLPGPYILFDDTKS